MSETHTEIPDREFFKPAEVCELAEVQPYVLRTWEKEFSRLGVATGAARTYRRSDVELVLRIKALVFGEGLTLSGARRRIEAESPPEPESTPADASFDHRTRERLRAITRELRALRDLLAAHPGGQRVQKPGTQAELPMQDSEAAEIGDEPRRVRTGATRGPDRNTGADPRR